MLTADEVLHVVVAVAVPVFAGPGSTLHDIVFVGGQVIETCPEIGAEWAKASHTDKALHINLFFKEEPWGLAPG